MLAFYICVNVAFGILRIMHWLLEKRWQSARDQFAHLWSVISGTPPPAPRHSIVRNGVVAATQTPDRENEVTHIFDQDFTGAFTDFEDFEASVPPRSGSPTLLHTEHDKIFRVLEGTFRFQCAGDVFDAAPGTTVVVARCVEHSWINLGITPGRISFTFVPTTTDHIFEYAAE